MENAAASLGTQLLPAATLVISAFSKLVGWFVDLDDSSKTVILIIGGIALALASIGLVLPPLIAGFGFLAVAWGVASGAGALFTTTLWANVAAWIALNIATGGIIIGIGLLIAGIVLLAQNWDTAVLWMKKGVNLLITAFEFFFKEVILFYVNNAIRAFNLLAGAFGKKIDLIELDIQRLDTSVQESAEVIEEANDKIIESNDTTVASFREVADAAIATAEAIVSGKAEEVERFIEFSEKAADETARRVGLEEIARQENIDAIIAWQDKRLALDEALADAQTALQEEQLAKDLRLFQFRQDAADALAERNSEAFAAIKATVDSLPSVIGADGSAVAGAGDSDRANVFRLFKASQNAVTDSLALAVKALAAGPTDSATSSQLQAEVDRLRGITGSSQFRGDELGQLFAPPGGFGSGGPPMLPGMMPFPVTINVEGSITAEDVAGTITQGLAEIAARGGGS